MNLKQLHDKLQAELKAARDVCALSESEGRDLTGEERTTVKAHIDAAAVVKGQLTEARQDAELVQAINEMGAGVELVSGAQGAAFTAAVMAGRGKTLGKQFTEAPEIKEWLRRASASGMVSERSRLPECPGVAFNALMKTLLTGDSDTSAGAFVESDRQAAYEPMGRRERTLLDLIGRRTTTSDLIEFVVRQTAKITQATVVPEANVTTYTGATGEVEGGKPEAALAFERVQTGVKTIAAWIPATKRALSDASQLRGIIDDELRQDLSEELEDQIWDGDGTGDNFTGITNTAGILTQAWDTDILTTTRKAKTALRITGRTRPTAWVLNPADWEKLELLKDSINHYYYGGPLSNGDPRLWGIPIVESEVVDEGTAALADWRKAVIWDREVASISVSDSHSDFFIRNLVAILAELRAAFGVIRPSAFILVDLESGS